MCYNVCMDKVPERNNLKELEFAIFCIENIATKLSVDAKRVYNALEESGVLKNYIFACYDVLHTQGKEYIIDDICRVMEKKGVRL